MSTNLIIPAWSTAVLAMLYFALAPAEAGGIGGAEYHGVAFMLLGLFTPAAWPRLQLVTVWMGLLALAGIIEIAQFLMLARRVASAEDWFLGAAAATIGVICYRIWIWLYARVQRERCEAAEEPTPPPPAPR
ncbi:MAG: VanZ family protein [Erythrobacter sp.]|nr:MAG: VanZ family protein [Erythrobacter sp.]